MSGHHQILGRSSSVASVGPSSGPLSAQALPAVAALSDGAIETYGDTRLQRSSSKKSPQSPSSLQPAGLSSNQLPNLSSDAPGLQSKKSVSKAISSMFKSFFRKDSIKERDSPEGGPFDLQSYKSSPNFTQPSWQAPPSPSGYAGGSVTSYKTPPPVLYQTQSQPLSSGSSFTSKVTVAPIQTATSDVTYFAHGPGSPASKSSTPKGPSSLLMSKGSAPLSPTLMGTSPKSSSTMLLPPVNTGPKSTDLKAAGQKALQGSQSIPHMVEVPVTVLPSPPPAPPTPTSQQPNGARTSIQLIEGEVQAAMKRVASITGRQHAPSTLLVVSPEIPPKMARAVWNLKDYAIIEKMYTGYASNVYKALCKHSGETVCLKSYSLGSLCDLNRFQIFREVKLHSSLSHEHVIKLYGAFQQADQVVLVQEFADAGDLFTLLHRYGGRLPERTAVELVLYPFLAVLNYLHSAGIAHRDIKPENILFTADMRLKLCDFGLAINMREERAVTRAGTLEYMAPEVLNCPFKNRPDENKENSALHYSFHVDAWAVGVLTYELLVGLPPFSDKARAAVETKIREEAPRFPQKMSELGRDFILRALEKDPLERPTIVDMINHRWIKIHKRSNSQRNLRALVSRSGGEPAAGADSDVPHPHQPQQQTPPVSAAPAATTISSSKQGTQTASSRAVTPTPSALTSPTASQGPASVTAGGPHSSGAPASPISAPATPKSHTSSVAPAAVVSPSVQRSNPAPAATAVAAGGVTAHITAASQLRPTAARGPANLPVSTMIHGGSATAAAAAAAAAAISAAVAHVHTTAHSRSGVAASAKSFTAGALPRAAFEPVTHTELMAAKLTGASRAATRELEVV